MKILDVPQSGSIAGVTSSRNRFGQYRRTRAIPVNPNTAAQSEMRGILAMCSGAWRDLSEAEAAAWNSWAATHPQTDALGQSITLTGAMAYNKINCLLVMLGVSAVTAPPDDIDTMPALTVDEVASPDSVSIAFTPTPVPASHKLLLYASPPQSGGRYFCGDYRFLVAKAAAQASPADVGTEYTARFGEFIQGQAIFFRARLIKTTTGAIGPWSNVLRAVA